MGEETFRRWQTTPAPIDIAGDAGSAELTGLRKFPANRKLAGNFGFSNKPKAEETGEVARK
ncbi:hypothetical protein [Sphingomonas sp.]|uniref:hypothetical protein n=1 Tax=Sphingomonas sp. TaxID=28214 RepID=UPI003751F902